MRLPQLLRLRLCFLPVNLVPIDIRQSSFHLRFIILILHPNHLLVAASLVVVPNMVVVCLFVVVVVVVAMSISNAKFDLNMATWQMFAFIGVILLFSLLILLCSMIPPLINLSPLPLLPLHPKSLILGSIHLHNLFLKFQLLCLPIQILTLLHLDTRF